MNKLAPSALAAVALFSTAPIQAERVFLDSFESADMSATNSAGFNWDKNNRTSVITADAVVYSNGETNIAMPPGREWETKEGDHALRFRYPAGQTMSEQRFTLGQHYPDIWFAYWIRVPINFYHGAQNNKFLSIWPGTYDRAGTVTWQTRPNSSGGASIVYQDGGVTGGETDFTPFISTPADRGRWMHVVARVKAASGPNTEDGVIQFFRRWENESTYTKIHEKLNADTWDDTSAEQGISQGYIMGWANDPYDSDTEWIIDEFSIHTTSPLDNVVSEGAPPNPPTLQLE